MLRLLTVGSVPPEWGGTTGGGVATVHRLLLLALAERQDVRVEVLPLNHDRSTLPPSDVTFAVPPADHRQERDFYARLVDRADAVLFFHIGHRWARGHARHHADRTAVGSIRSWHQITHAPADRAQCSRDVLREALTGMARLVFPSRHTLDEGRSLGLRYDCPAEVIGNPVHPEFLLPPLGERRGVVFVGNLIPRKRADLAVTAASRLGRTCTVIGDGPEGATLRRDFGQLRPGARFLGALPPERVATEVARAEALCVPSESESFGNVYVEAIACGTPVVGFGPTLAEILDRLGVDAGEGVHPPADDAVTAALDRVLGRQWDHAGLREAVRNRCAPAPVAEQYLAAVVSSQG